MLITVIVTISLRNSSFRKYYTDVLDESRNRGYAELHARSWNFQNPMILSVVVYCTKTAKTAFSDISASRLVAELQ